MDPRIRLGSRSRGGRLPSGGARTPLAEGWSRDERTMDHPNEMRFIGGRWQKPVGAHRIEVRSASTEESLGSVPEAAEGDIDLAVAAAQAAFADPAGWARWGPARRGEALERVAVALGKRGEQFAQLVSSQNGMPISIGRVSEAVSGQALPQYYAALAQQQPAEETRPS